MTGVQRPLPGLGPAYHLGSNITTEGQNRQVGEMRKGHKGQGSARRAHTAFPEGIRRSRRSVSSPRVGPLTPPGTPARGGSGASSLCGTLLMCAYPHTNTRIYTSLKISLKGGGSTGPQGSSQNAMVTSSLQLRPGPGAGFGHCRGDAVLQPTPKPPRHGTHPTPPHPSRSSTS